jgi:signal transduction histidine kinase
MQLGHQIRKVELEGMSLESIRERLLPHEERDARFRQYLARLTAPGVQTLAVVEIAASLLLQFARMAVGRDAAVAARWWQTGAMILVGLLTLLMARFGRMRAAPRLLGACSAWAAAAFLLVVSGWHRVDIVGAGDSILAAITLVLVTASALLPLLPWQALLMGLGVEGVYILSSRLAAHGEIAPAAPAGEPHHIFLVLLALLVTGIAAANYDHWRAEFAAQQEAVRVAETLAGAQLRAQLADNAISVGKMAAALSHEINSPLGTLRSSVDTLVALTDRQVQVSPAERVRLAETREALVRSIGESAERIDEVTRRLRRFVTLEDSEVKSADINELLSDVTLLHQRELDAAHVRLDVRLEPSLPPLHCRPQLLSTVFSTVLRNAIQAVNGDGRIAIETRASGDELQVTIRDNGRGMSAEAADIVFEPSFKVSDGRVASGNWSLFNSRQIVYEHGGDIRLETAEGQGTAVHVTLPVA